MIGEVIGSHERIDGQLKGKMKAFRDMEECGMPKILNEYGTLKYYEPWRYFFRCQATTCPQMDLTMLNGIIDKFNTI